MNSIKLAIIIPTYNRPKSLKRLLYSLSYADYSNHKNIDLIVSCDHSGDDNCIKVAENHDWLYGSKTVIKHNKNLGLRQHILLCGDLVKDYDGIIMLEDDLLVSPNFFKYVIAADSHFKTDKSIGQISLYNYQYEDYSASKFIAIPGIQDNYFMQVPSSWGQYWSKDQWLNFRAAYDNGELEIKPDDLLPTQVKMNWPESSWKKYFYKYLITRNLFVVYPYLSLSTNFGEGGTHYKNKVCYTQTPMDYRKGYTFRFINLDQANVIYDYNFELHLSAIKQHLAHSNLKEYDIEFDLNGTKELSKIHTEYTISSKECHNPIKKFANDLLPQEFNIIYELEGDFYSLAKTIDFIESEDNANVLNRNISFIPLVLKYRIQSVIKTRYENSNSFKLANKIARLYNKISFKKK